MSDTKSKFYWFLAVLSIPVMISGMIEDQEKEKAEAAARAKLKHYVCLDTFDGSYGIEVEQMLNGHWSVIELLNGHVDWDSRGFTAKMEIGSKQDLDTFVFRKLNDVAFVEITSDGWLSHIYERARSVKEFPLKCKEKSKK